MNVYIRPVEEKDNAPLAQMIRRAFVEYNAPRLGTVFSDPTTDNLFKLFREPGSILWVAEIDTESLGCCGIYPTPGLPDKCAELVKFYLSVDLRGKGIGRTLMQKCIDSAIMMGYTQIYLESLPEFSNAVNIYENQGFVRLPHPLGNSGHTGCNIWMLKNL
jgi:putative acetyltransferase